MSNDDSTPNDIPDKLRDGRDAGEWVTAYNYKALTQIYVELAYLLLLLFISIAILYKFAFVPAPAPDGKTCPLCGEVGFDQAYWICVALGGLIGGIVFALKWHYHSVAKRIWHQDRLVWRITAPILSGVLAMFVIMLIRADIVPLIGVEKISTIPAATSFSFFLGLFSDNLLASLQNLAAQMFGTLKDRNQTDVKAERKEEKSDYSASRDP